MYFQSSDLISNIPMELDAEKRCPTDVRYSFLVIALSATESVKHGGRLMLSRISDIGDWSLKAFFNIW